MMIKFVLILHFLVITCSPFLPSCTGQNATTLASRESYLVFPEWVATPQRILRFTFRTSELNGVLLYSEGFDRPDYLLIRLVNGTVEFRLSLEEDNVETKTLGEFLNDNQPHDLTVYHNPDPQILQLEYMLDSEQVVEEYASGLVPAFGPGGVYIGGAPPNEVLPTITSLVNGTSFIGCVENVLSANGSITGSSIPSSMLQTLEPEMGGEVQDGCPDPCLDVDCGEGHCVARLPNQTFCDCRGTGMLGEDCSEDTASHELTFDPGSDVTHYCHQILPEPYTAGANSVSLRLVPPIPSEGTILVAHPDNGRHSFSLRVEAGRVVFEYEPTDNITRRLTLDTDLELLNTVYQIDLSMSSRTAELVLLSVSSEWTTVVERQSTGSGNVLYTSSTIFTTVCVGGSLIEYKSYVGTIRSAFYSFNSLLEERNFCQLATEGVGRSDLVVFADNGVPRVLAFERFPLGSHRIAFQARSRAEDPSGILLLVENFPYHFSLNTFGVGLFVVLRRDVIDGEMKVNFDCSAFDGEWHSYEIMLVADPPSIVVTVDGVMSCGLLTSNFSSEAIPMLVNASLQFGATSNFFLNGVGQVSIFTGCVSGFEFQLTPESEVFRPNLEAAPRNSDNFEVGACFHCVNKNMFCENGRVCTDRAKDVEAVCECPEGLTGEMCDEFIGREVSLRTLIPNFTCHFVPRNITSTTAQQTPLSTEPSHTSSPPSSTPTTAPPPVPKPRTISVGGWVGLGVAIAVVLILLASLLIGSCILYRRGARIRGFYQTNESSSQDTPMVRYSASLRQLSSEIVSIDKESPNELSWSHKNGDYVNGGPLSKPTNQMSISASRDKEFYL